MFGWFAQCSCFSLCDHDFVPYIPTSTTCLLIYTVFFSFLRTNSFWNHFINWKVWECKNLWKFENGMGSCKDCQVNTEIISSIFQRKSVVLFRWYKYLRSIVKRSAAGVGNCNRLSIHCNIVTNFMVFWWRFILSMKIYALW